MGEVEWADTDIHELDITCGSCEAKWKSPAKVIDGKTVIKKPCPKCGWNYTTLIWHQVILDSNTIGLI